MTGYQQYNKNLTLVFRSIIMFHVKCFVVLYFAKAVLQGALELFLYFISFNRRHFYEYTNKVF